VQADKRVAAKSVAAIGARQIGLWREENSMKRVSPKMVKIAFAEMLNGCLMHT
jgi:hypothetical protein